jgi:hypothetical protein
VTKKSKSLFFVGDISIVAKSPATEYKAAVKDNKAFTLPHLLR